MSNRASTFILSPNLGCPEIIAPEAINSKRVPLVLATPHRTPQWGTYRLHADPSYPNDGQGFELAMCEPKLLDRSDLPQQFEDIGSTRLLISTFLRTQVLPDHDFWCLAATPCGAITADNLRTVAGQPRGTLYDLVLSRDGKDLSRVQHALYLRPRNPAVRFIHLTDLHVAARNDLWETEVSAIISPSLSLGKTFVNFNERLRMFIRAANEAADADQVDFVLALGDLVDFVRLGVVERGPGDNNWSTLIQILTGSHEEPLRGNPGLRVPLFTTTGNHDWRVHPYPPEVSCEIFNMSKQGAQELDCWYHDTAAEISKKIGDVNERLIREGSPILAPSWWGSLASMGWRGLQVGLARLGTRVQAAVTKYLKESLTVLVAGLLVGSRAASEHPWWRVGLVAAAIVGLAVMAVGQRWMYAWLRKTIESFIALEAGVNGLSDYFLRLSPYFNYAVRLENCYFLVLDTGHDCLTAESFWDDGAKKLGPVSVRDNILGGSPDTMAFYPPNEHYAYSQIAWLEAMLACIQREQGQKAGEPRRCRIFVGLHTPVANLSKKARQAADERLNHHGTPVIMTRSRLPLDLEGFDIRYGTVNHYLSEFYYLCLGYREGELGNPSGPGIDAVLAGHAHWSIEFKLRKPEGHSASWSPQVVYGKFSEGVEQSSKDATCWWGPLLLQTAACGPPSHSDPDTPNFRYITVDADMGVCNLRPRTLKGPPVPWTVGRAAVGAR